MPARGHVAPERSGDARHERRGTPRVAASDRSRSSGRSRSGRSRAMSRARGARAGGYSYWLAVYVTHR
jgi:hypothetical protein